nr:unnamed protein product [Digitaria exilis]
MTLTPSLVPNSSMSQALFPPPEWRYSKVWRYPWRGTAIRFPEPCHVPPPLTARLIRVPTFPSFQRATHRKYQLPSSWPK